jgi:hypothetical protein
MNAKTIKSLLTIAVVCCAPLAFAADTNTIPFLTIGGQTFTNVEIGTVTASHVTVFYNGGGQQVAISNLPAYLQKRFNYDPAKAAAVEQAEAEKKAAARASIESQQAEFIRAQAPIGEPVRVRILQILLAPNQYKVSANGVEQTVTITPIPKDVIDFINRINVTREQLDALKAEQQSQRQYAAKQRALANATEHWNDDDTVNPNYSARQLEANLAEVRSREQLAQISELTSELAKMSQEELMKTTILARPTGWAPSSVRLWKFVGMPAAAGLNR